MKKLLLVLLIFAAAVADHDDEQEVADGATGFTVDVFHRNSPPSPFYDPSLNETEVLLQDIMSSSSTARFTTSKEASTIVYPRSFGGYLMRIYVGTPPIEQIVAVDTGSSLVWIQCEPCSSCFKQDIRMFYKNNSQSYNALLCETDICDFYKEITDCRRMGMKYCGYWLTYMDGTWTKGELAMESVGLNPYQTQTVLIGCGSFNGGKYFPDESGVCGLGPGNQSLASQLGGGNGLNFFSYCFPPSTSQIPGKLTFQPRSSIYNKPGVTSALLVNSQDDGFYYTIIDGISVKDDPEVLDPTDDYDKLAVDSGTPLSWLYTDLFEKVKAKVIQVMGRAPMASPPDPFKLCYAHSSLGEVPDLSLHFSGATLRLTVPQVWFYYGQQDTLCFMFRPHTSEINILGSRQQINMKVEFNVQYDLVSFQPKDCGVEGA